MKSFYLRNVFFCCLLLIVSRVNGQVVNPDILYQLDLVKITGGITNYNQTNPITTYQTSIQLDNDNSYFDATSGKCSYSNNGGPLTITFGSDMRASSPQPSKTHLAVMSFIKGDYFCNPPSGLSDPCYYNHTISSACFYGTGSPFDSLITQKGFSLDDPFNTPKNSLNYKEFTLDLSPGIATFRHYWRYVNGSRLDNALNFDNIPIGTTLQHTNNNYGTPYGNTDYQDLGYQDVYNSTNNNSNFQASPDVFYTFYVTDPSLITISTNYPATNFSTSIHLLKSDGTVLASNDIAANNHTITYAVCPNEQYYIDVEGVGTAMGTFQLSVSAAQAENQLFSHVIPKPQELLKDSVSASPSFAGTNYNDFYTVQWQKSTDLINWFNIAGDSGTRLQYYFPALTATTYYQRLFNFKACGLSLPSNIDTIKVVLPDGLVTGSVTSRGGAPVDNIIITVTKTAALRGSPQTIVYRDTTGPLHGHLSGEYSIPRVFYGDVDFTSTSSTGFSVKASLLHHTFTDSIKTITLSSAVKSQKVDFVDLTGYSVTGSTYQQCNTCIITGSQPTQTCPLDGVQITSNATGVAPVLSGYSPQSGAYGMYALSILNPGTDSIKASFKNHLFNNGGAYLIKITGDTSGINFNDTSTHQINGTFKAGCNEYIGTATLEFTDVLPNDAQGNIRTCFKKRVTTTVNTGAYSIRLPARKYRVQVVGFTVKPSLAPPLTESTATLMDFVNKQDSSVLVRDITERDTTLNLVYARPPVITLSGLDNDCTTGGFAVIKQGVNKTIIVKVTQGATSCPVADTNLVLYTNIQKDDESETIPVATQNGQSTILLKGGTPNLLAPYYKPLNIQFTDIYGRSAVALNPNVVVTGVKAGTGTFTTVSPEVPLMILHDPPGDKSYSYWESGHTIQSAVRFFGSRDTSTNKWDEIKLGITYDVGVGEFVTLSTELSDWGSIGTTIGATSQSSSDHETIVSTTTSSSFSTSDNQKITGAKGDVFIGAALNLLYSVATELVYTPPCGLALQKKMIMAENGFATQYIYSEDHIRNNIIPTLIAFTKDSTVKADKKNDYIAQIKVWQQVLANNDAQKKYAIFVKNISFDAGSGPIDNSVSTTKSETNTIEFSMEMDTTVEHELGWEIAGSGISGGDMRTFKMETGSSTSSGALSETTIGYHIEDDDPGDYYTVDIRKDRVYGTPVFDLVAGTSSCPYEEGTQPRDEMSLSVPVPSISGVAANEPAVFSLLVGNTSESGETRTYNLSFDGQSNPDGAIVTVAGAPAPTGTNFIPYRLGYLAKPDTVTVTVQKGPKNVYAYQGLKFTLSDACDGSVSKTATISAFFNSACSNISLSSPGNNWVSASSDNNLLPVTFSGYNVANLTSVTLQYSKVGLDGWTDAFTKNAADLTPGNTTANWNTSLIADGAYNLRMKLNCTSGTTYSESVTGIIDRQSPQLFGITQPSDDSYITGDEISASYNEPIDCNDLTNYNVRAIRLSNGQVIDARLGCYQNKIVVVPINSIAGFVGDSIRVTLNNISDVYGNMKRIGDSWAFVIGSSVASTASNALKVTNSPASLKENSGDTIVYTFKLPVNAPNDVRVNYSISGNATLNTDYKIAYGQASTAATSYNGSDGSIIIKQGTKSATLKVIPIGDTVYSGNKIITLSLTEGGDYVFSDSTSATGTILNDDAVHTYTFTGNGNFSDTANWQNRMVPPYGKLIYDQIIINPVANGKCILDVPLRMRSGGNLTIMAGKQLVINGNLSVAKY